MDPASRPAVRSLWTVLVEYSRSCVVRESLVAPVPLNDRSSWAVLPMSAESVLCGDDRTVPLTPEVDVLFAGLEPLEGVFYGWPTVVVLDDRNRPFVTPLFVRQLAEPDPSNATVPVDDLLPQVNMGLLGVEWFSVETLASAAATLAGATLGYGQAEMLARTASRLLTALGIPLPELDPHHLIDLTGLEDPWRPQEVGVFNMAMAFKGTLDLATRNLVKDLDWMANAKDWGLSAARFLFEAAPEPTASLPESCAVRLNDAQEKALACAAAAPLTVITGPPGTGKSQTVTAILADAWRRGETAMLASTNNTPIDDVIDSKAASVDDALVLRTGNAEKRQQLGGRLRELVDRVAVRAEQAPSGSLSGAATRRHHAAYALQRRAEVAQQMLYAALRRDEARELWPHGQLPPESRHRAIRARAAKAVTTRWRWLRRRRTGRLLAFACIANPATTAGEVLAWVDAEATFAVAAQQLSAFHNETPPNLLDDFHRSDDDWRGASVDTVRNLVRDGFVEGAESLFKLADVLTEDLPRREATEQAMAYVKAWATSALSVRPNVDCRAGVIDLVIIDEASQCNLAQILPLAYRAKRLVVVGDPQQLAPVVTANAEELRMLAGVAGTTHDQLVDAHHTYGEDSAYTAFAARVRPEPILLDEHYRCHPDIVRYCNEQFYRNQLTVLTAVNRDGNPVRGLEWHDVDGRTEPGPTGGALNNAEAEAVVRWVMAAGLPADRIGVVTPFRAQATRMKTLLRQSGNSEFANVRVGTAHTFQGGERDTIVFSTVISDNASPGTVAWLEGERNLINVAVSRAKQHLVVFGNRAELRRQGAKTLLGLADAAENVACPPDAIATPVVRKLHAALVGNGIPASLGAMDEGYPLAIALPSTSGNRINVEVDEFPDGDARGRGQRQLATRDANLERLGWQVLRVPGWEAYLNTDAVTERIRQLSTL